MKYFISQPMKGLTIDEINKNRQNIKEKIIDNDKNAKILESVLKENFKPLKMLGESIKIMSEADIVIFMKGWENGRGCKIEHECCKQYGIKIIYE